LVQVHFKGLKLSPFGAAFKVSFSTERAGKQIRWEQSKRLLQGSMVALSPASDMFEKVCKIAIVAGRPIFEGLDQNPPVIDLFWGDPSDVAFDPVERTGP
jgi:helicase required for RNAi-mediated heterochromatin assembly 1